MIVEYVQEVATWKIIGLPIGIYGVITLSYILSKIVLSRVYSSYDSGTNDGNNLTVTVIIPEYNEDPHLFERGLQSVVAQSDMLQEVWVIDDGSADTAAYEVAQQYAEKYDVLNAHRLSENCGKRFAQAQGFIRASSTDVFVTMDSDTILEDGAIQNLLHPFENESVTAVTGYPKVVNSDVNTLTKLIDMRYWVAFNVERAAQSVFGTVVCCCGVLSAYRSDVVLENLDEYTSQTFLGTECTFGDDRHLTTHALRSGKVVYQSTAVSLTDAPETIREYLIQQTRWMRSFWRESVLALQWSWKRSMPLTTMLVIDLLLPFALVLFGFGFMMVRTATVTQSIPVFYVGVIMGIAYLRNLEYSTTDIRTYLLSPVYAILYLFVLLPLSFYALLTVRSNGWGTR